MNWAVAEQSGWHKTTIAMAGAVVAAVLIKVFLLYVVIPYLYQASPSTYTAEGFADWYDLIAMNLVEGNGYRFFPDTAETMVRTPGYVLVLAGIFSVFGHSLAAAKAFNLLFSFATAYVVYVLGKRVTMSHRLALIAATVTFLHPAFLIADSRGGLESLFTLTLMVFMLLTYRAIKTDAIKDYVFAGIALGVCLLIKSTPALFPAVLFLYLVALRPNLARVRTAIIRVGALSLVAGVVLSPWIIRNYALSGNFVPTMSVGGMAAYGGLHDVLHPGRENYLQSEDVAAEMDAMLKEMKIPYKPGYYPQFYNIADEVNFYRHLGDIAKKRYLEEPSLLLRVMATNAIGFWINGRTTKATVLNSIIGLPLLALAIWGAYIGWRRSLPVGPIVLFIVAFYLAHLPILGQARYHVPLIPLLAILACIPLRSVIGDVSTASGKRDG